MQTNIQSISISKTSRWVSYGLSGLAIAFLMFDTVIKLAQETHAIEATVGLGYRANLVPVLGVVELICLALYVFPRTAPLGAVLMTGYLGGAVATHVQNGSEPFSLVFPIIIGALVWGGLALREGRLRALMLK